MSGLYIHIPFCKHRCYYCNFYSIPLSKKNKKLRNYRTAFVSALIKEIALQHSYLENEEISTIYFGGGTPSLLAAGEIEDIFDSICKYFRIASNTEITFEANPDDISNLMLQNIKKSPVNRLSIGIQSFFDDDLAYLSRIHDAKQALRSVEISRELGFENLSVDLIYGIPTLNEKKWRSNLERIIKLQIPHLSSYALTIEPKTTLEWLINKRRKAGVDEDQVVANYKVMLEELNTNGYLNYEISNFAIPGHESAHNSNYWKGITYLGLGPSAHSYNRISRQWNVSDVGMYISSIQEGKFAYEKEILTLTQKYNEYVMTSIRTIWGSDLGYIETNFGTSYKELFRQNISGAIEKKFVVAEADVFRLTDKGKLFADAIASDLFME